MLSENQVKRILKHCEMVAESTGNAKNHGWIQALRLVLHDSDKVVIRKDPMEEKDD